MKQVFSTALTDSKTTDVEGVGALRYGENGEVYRWVKNAESSTAVTEGQAVCHAFSDAASMLQNVTIPATANLALLAGVVVSTSIAAGSYGWIQCFGVNSTVSVSVPGTTVKGLGTHLKGVNAATYLDTDVSVGVAPIYSRTIQLLETIATVTTATTGNKKAYIRCM